MYTKSHGLSFDFPLRFKSPYVCPIAGLEMNGKFKFVFDWNKGKVLSERGHKIVMKNDPDMRIDSDSLVVLNADEKEEADAMLANMEARRAKAKAEKAAKKAAKRSNGAAPAAEEGSSSKAAKVESKAVNEAASSSSSSAKTSNGKHSSSVQKDPSKSEVYKSLFSSHKSAANKPKGHWVTFDPRYN